VSVKHAQGLIIALVHVHLNINHTT
jgi:hypothetical protein